MVYTASGQPLYLPPHARRHRSPSEHDLGSDIQDNGMQSLLSAIELDMSNRSLPEHISETSLHSSFVDSPDHQELMADLLRTNFTNEDVSHNAGHSIQNTDVGLSAYEQHIGDLLVDQQFHLPETQSMQQDNQPDYAPLPSKRSWPGVDDRWQDRDVRRQQIQRAIAENLEYLNGQSAVASNGRVTKISFAWPTVAQKSYGSEKRLLTPAPICRISGYRELLCGSNPRAHLSVLPEDGSLAVVPQTLSFDHSLKVNYKNLHINNDNIGKSKTVRLKLQIPQKDARDATSPSIVELSSSDVTLLSKPSKRTSRLKQQSSYVSSGDSISLYNRINSQTVRTKYLSCEEHQLSVQPDTWSPFQIYACINGELDMTRINLTYGMTVVLTHESSGFVSIPMLVRRLEGGVVEDSNVSGISQMQKIILERVQGADEPTSETTSDGLTLPVKRSRTFLSARQAQMQKEVVSSALATFEAYPPRNDGSGLIAIDDSGQWTIVGVGSTQFTLLDTLSATSESQTTVPPQSTNANINSFNDVHDRDDLPPDSKRRRVDLQSEQHKVSSDPPDRASPRPQTGDLPEPTSSQPPVTTTTTTTTTTTAAIRPSPLPSAPPTVSPPTSASEEPTTTTPTQPSTPDQIPPITPFPTLLTLPIFLPTSNRLHLEIRDFWHPSSSPTFTPLEIWVGDYGPLPITALQQSIVYYSDVTIEVELPTRDQVSGITAAPLLFVRENGLVVVGGCQVDIVA